jgi:DUF4097 and DUF4098 domain-containing protein YvlB
MNFRALAAAAALLLATAVAADVKETEEYDFDIDPGGRISLENINGDVRVTGGSGDSVVVIVHKKAGNQDYMDELKVLIKAEDEYIRIETQHPDSEGGWFKWGNDSSGSVSYELTVPANVNLDTIETINGEVSISGVSGVVKAETVNGDLEISGLNADVDLETTNGEISADFETLGSGQKVKAETVNGRIVVRLPANVSARVRAETVNGSIDADDFGLEPEKGFVGRDLDGQIGDGAASISLDTINGSIRLKKK